MRMQSVPDAASGKAHINGAETAQKTNHPETKKPRKLPSEAFSLGLCQSAKRHSNAA
jgi:hypothetical protein